MAKGGREGEVCGELTSGRASLPEQQGLVQNPLNLRGLLRYRICLWARLFCWGRAGEFVLLLCPTVALGSTEDPPHPDAVGPQPASEKTLAPASLGFVAAPEVGLLQQEEQVHADFFLLLSLVS